MVKSCSFVRSDRTQQLRPKRIGLVSPSWVLASTVVAGSRFRRRSWRKIGIESMTARRLVGNSGNANAALHPAIRGMASWGMELCVR